MCARPICSVVAGVMAVLAVAASAPAQQSSEADREYAFASWLVENGLADFAERLVDQLARRFPDQAERGRVILAESLIARRRFADAEAIAAAMPKDSPRTQAVRLAIAKGYYRVGEIEKARAIYDAFFSQYKGGIPTDPDFRRFYMDSAYQFAKMLEAAGDLRGAAAAFEKVLQASQEEADVARRLSAELAQLWVRAAESAPAGAAREEMLKKAKALCDEIQWKGLDLWFGQSVITLAHIEIVRGKKDAAAKLIRDYMDILRQLDDILKKEEIPMALSPMAGARYLLGEIYREQAEAALAAGRSDEGVDLLVKALTEYFNVFARYAESEWAFPAGERSNDLKARLEAMGRKVTINPGPYMKNIIQARFRLADNLFMQRRYAEAAAQYLSILNQFPSFEGVGRPLTNLIVCYAHEKDTLAMRAVAEHIVERYASDADAPTGLLAAAKICFDRAEADSYLYLYNLFVDRYPREERTPMVLFSLSGIMRNNGNEEAANAYLQRIIRDYPDDQYYLRALNHLAWSHYRAQRFDEAVKTFRLLIEKTPPSHDRALAQFSLADAYVRMNDFTQAIRAFETLQQWLGPTGENPAYGQTSAEIAKNRELLRNATFYLGYSLSRLDVPPDRQRAVRATAVKMLEDFVAKFGETELAPKAMSIIGSIHLELGDSAKAASTFDELARRYPTSEEGRSAHYARISAAVELGRPDTAREAWNEVRREPARFSLDQIVRMGDLMRKAGLLEEAMQAYDLVRGNDTADRTQLEPALFGLSSAAYDAKKYEEAVAALTDLMRRYPRSGLFYQAKFMLGRAYRELGRLPEAVDALNEVFRFATDPVLINTANMELAEIQIRMARAFQQQNRPAEQREQILAALASYQRVIISGNDPKDPKVRPMIEDALAASVPLFLEIGFFDRAVENCETYLNLYPDGSRVSDFRRWREEARLKAVTAQP